jgi:predicted HTH domain antitoxin
LEFEKQMKAKKTQKKRFPDYLHMLQPQRALDTYESADQWNGRVKAINVQIEESEKTVVRRLAENARTLDTKFDQNAMKLEQKDKGLDTQVQKIYEHQDQLGKKVELVETKLSATVTEVSEVVKSMKSFDTMLKQLEEVLEKQTSSNERQLDFARTIQTDVAGITEIEKSINEKIEQDLEVDEQVKQSIQENFDRTQENFNTLFESVVAQRDETKELKKLIIRLSPGSVANMEEQPEVE